MASPNGSRFASSGDSDCNRSSKIMLVTEAGRAVVAWATMQQWPLTLP